MLTSVPRHWQGKTVNVLLDLVKSIEFNSHIFQKEDT